MTALSVQPGGRYIDCTVGTGGHATAILERCSPGGQLLGIDADPEAVAAARAQLRDYGDSCLMVNGNFHGLHDIALKHDFLPVHGIIFDLGMSSLQLESSSRGFSFQYDGPLDMRFGPEQEITAADIVNSYSEAKLARLLKTYGEEGYARQIARYIVRERPINSTLKLVWVIGQAVGGRRGRLHPATKTFQALRIAVNRELENLETALRQAVGLLGYQGRLVVISYHSLEDRIVKNFMRQESRDCICPSRIPACICNHRASMKTVGRRIITPTYDEVQQNPRSRSARLRVAERVIARDEQYLTVERLCYAMEGQANGWRRPALLKKLQQAFATA